MRTNLASGAASGRAWLAALALLALAACAGGDEADGGALGPAAEGAAADPANPLGPVLGRLGAALGAEPASAQALDPALYAPEAIAAAPEAFRLVQVNALGLVEPARLLERHGSEDTYRLRSGPTAAFDEGVLVATRGFGDDLHAMDSRGILAVLRAGGGSLSRAMETLDAQNQVVTSAFECAVTAAGPEEVDLGLRRATLGRLDETCRSPALVFQNIYWLDGAGNIAASRQYVSPSVAYLRANRL